MLNTLYQKTSGKFLEKTAEIKILGETNGKSKQIGKVSLNLVDFMEVPASELILPIEKCPDKSAEVCLSIKAERVDPEEETIQDIIEGSFEEETKENRASSLSSEEQKRASEEGIHFQLDMIQKENLDLKQQLTSAVEELKRTKQNCQNLEREKLKIQQEQKVNQVEE